ncbi:MAG: FtsQ-type POTRA domain-containing protein [Actinomycetota bacterium]
MTATVGIDPRIRERRIAVQRDVGHRRLRRLQALGAIVLGLGLAFALTRSPLLDVDRVTVDTVGAESGVDADRVREAAAIAPGTPLTSIDPAAIAASVSALPDVAAAQVRREWPGAVRIDVTPRTPAAAVVGADGGWYLVDGDGVVVRHVDEAPEGMVVLGDLVVRAAPGAALPAAERSAAAVTAALPPSLGWRVTSVGAHDGEVQALLADGGVVAFALDGDHPAAAAAASAVVETVPPGCVERVDVVVAEAPVLRRAPGC